MIDFLIPLLNQLHYDNKRTFLLNNMLSLDIYCKQVGSYYIVCWQHFQLFRCDKFRGILRKSFDSNPWKFPLKKTSFLKVFESSPFPQYLYDNTFYFSLP